MRVRLVCTRVCASFCAGGCVYPCLGTRICSCDPVRVPTQKCACCMHVKGDAWTVSVHLCAKCTRIRAHMGVMYTPAWVERAVHTGGFPHLCMHACVQAGVCVSALCTVFYPHVHTRVQVRALLCVRPSPSRDGAGSA